MQTSILVAGIGNIFLGDDGFGSDVIRALGETFGPSPDVRVIDYGIGGMHLAYDLLDPWGALVLVDALPDRGSPGTLHVFVADLESLSATAALDAHGMDPGTVFASLRALGGTAPPTVVVGCEVAETEDGIGLSEPVRAAVPEAVRAVRTAVAAVRETLTAQGGMKQCAWAYPAGW
ncbi:hydrogenase maturation protease [Mycobacterium sp. CVI_P3]|uniref:Hydrogenase maturation protease n=1 Tax=Mycobacterium pinniadriaticum TaxID=2994102 RepID=A0ABT3SBL8_9MYCO|nr:hydrogenase maturation protease [Mycobacterium pinniadriaticum]MCX2929817.1 hydrogenase maturation protease [Mycobacterium pinniadriaticum]MCX2936534.1 hydrogenase maturation protease [Mycobacterium pinniadriaticum]